MVGHHLGVPLSQELQHRGPPRCCGWQGQREQQDRGHCLQEKGERNQNGRPPPTRSRQCRLQVDEGP
eukprot:3547325-Prorocentrum_lima.AAC.1